MDTYPTTEEWDDDLTEVRGRVKIPAKLSRLRRKLSQKAEREPKFRFYTLYGRIIELDTLRTAYALVRAKKGSAGIDGVAFEDIEGSEDGVEGFLRGIEEDLRSKSYRPQPVRRVYIPKASGKLRPLGIPTIRDRVVQAAVLLIIEPIFEADFLDCSYGFRPGRSAHDALVEIRSHVDAGFREVYDADLQGYFDSIPHDKLMACVERRISDRSVLRLIRLWLQAPVVDRDEDGRPKYTRPRQGTPQGGVLSPLLANLFLHYFDKLFHRADGPAQWANAKLVRYADDFVVLARYQGTRLVNFMERELEGRFGLTLNREKTRIVTLNEDGASLDFLGYTFRFQPDRHGRTHKYLHVGPSKKSLNRARERLRELTASRWCFLPLPELIQRTNRYLKGWSKYFGYGYPRSAFRTINSYTRQRLTVHVRRRSQRPMRPPKGVTYYAHFQRLGLTYL